MVNVKVTVVQFDNVSLTWVFRLIQVSQISSQHISD